MSLMFKNIESIPTPNIKNCIKFTATDMQCWNFHSGFQPKYHTDSNRITCCACGIAKIRNPRQILACLTILESSQQPPQLLLMAHFNWTNFYVVKIEIEMKINIWIYRNPSTL